MCAREDDGESHQHTVGTDMCTSKVGFKEGNLKCQRGGVGLSTLDDGFKGRKLKRDGRKAKQRMKVCSSRHTKKKKIIYKMFFLYRVSVNIGLFILFIVGF